MQLERTHRLVRDFERMLEIFRHRQQPVEVVGITLLLAELAHRRHAGREMLRDAGRIVHHDGESLERLLAERSRDEATEMLEVTGTLRRPCEDHGEWLIAIRGV